MKLFAAVIIVALSIGNLAASTLLSCRGSGVKLKVEHTAPLGFASIKESLKFSGTFNNNLTEFGEYDQYLHFSDGKGILLLVDRLSPKRSYLVFHGLVSDKLRCKFDLNDIAQVTRIDPNIFPITKTCLNEEEAMEMINRGFSTWMDYGVKGARADMNQLPGQGKCALITLHVEDFSGLRQARSTFGAQMGGVPLRFGVYGKIILH